MLVSCLPYPLGRFTAALHLNLTSSGIRNVTCARLVHLITRRDVLAASHATFRDCLAAFTRRLLTGGSYSRIPYYAFVDGRFSSISHFPDLQLQRLLPPSLFCSFRLRPSVVPTQAKEALASLCTPCRTSEHRNRKPCLERAYMSRLSSMSVPSDVRSFARFL